MVQEKSKCLAFFAPRIKCLASFSRNQPLSSVSVKGNGKVSARNPSTTPIITCPQPRAVRIGGFPGW